MQIKPFGIEFVLLLKLIQANSLSDHDLFRDFVEKQKPEHLFAEVVKRYKQKVYWQVRRIVISHDDADEVSQIVFIKLWKNAESFQFNSALSSFIYRIAYNESVTFLKQKNKFQSFDDLLDSDGNYNKMIDSGSEIEGEAILKKLQLALLTLPEKQRLVFNYKYFDDLQYNEIADITGTSVGALKSSYHFAVEKIKKYFGLD
ncbi:MAG: sigma-70 family RNA polymerase sigma factor [Bacteroidota bacterium]